jgi:hypothetical protein
MFSPEFGKKTHVFRLMGLVDKGGVRPEVISKNRPTGYKGFGLKGQQAL